MPLKIRLQPPVSVETPDVQHIRMFVDVNGVAKVKYPSGNVVDLTAMVGPAGGDLSGSYPNPSVVATPALETTGAPVSTEASAPPVTGYALRATSNTAATWQVIPSLPPSGIAGGDLVGNYPSPTVVRAKALTSATTTVDVSTATAPTADQVLIATSDSTAEWQTFNPTPSGPAGGDLSGSYPDPGVLITSSLKSATTNVVTSLTTGPSGGELLVASSPVAAGWRDPSTDLSGGTWSAPLVMSARGLKTATTTVEVASSSAPAVGRILRATSGSSATWQALDQYTRNSVWDPPLSADSADQEFTVDPFVAGTWVARFSSTMTLLTRAGDVDIRTMPSSGTYRSTLAGSTVFVQVYNGDGVALVTANPVGGATSGDQLWMCGMGWVSEIASTAGGPFFSLQVWATSGGLPDVNNRAFFGTWNPNSTGVSDDLHGGVVTGGSFVQGPQFISNSMGVTGMPGFLIRKGTTQQSGSGSSSITFGTFSPTGAIGGLATLGTSFPGIWSWAGFLVIPNLATTWGPAAWGGGGVVALHFIRRKLGATAGLWG